MRLSGTVYVYTLSEGRELVGRVEEDDEIRASE